MANYKRKKSKRNVRCCLCTKHRHLGNNKERRKAKERAERKQADKDIRDINS